jgi:hypothetical protein
MTELKPIRFTCINSAGIYICDGDDESSGEYYRAEDVRALLEAANLASDALDNIRDNASDQEGYRRWIDQVDRAKSALAALPSHPLHETLSD